MGLARVKAPFRASGWPETPRGFRQLRTTSGLPGALAGGAPTRQPTTRLGSRAPIMQTAVPDSHPGHLAQVANRSAVRLQIQASLVASGLVAVVAERHTMARPDLADAVAMDWW